MDTENIIRKIENSIGKDDVSEQEIWLRIKQLCTNELQSFIPNTPLKNLTQLTEELFAGKKSQNCMPTEFAPLDKLIGGFCEDEFIVVGGRPAMGKTLFLLQTGLNMSKKYPVLFLSYDLSEYRLICKILSILSEVEAQNIANNQLTEDEFRRLEYAKKELSNYQLTINAEAYKSIDVLIEYCTQQITNQGIKVIMLDFLQMLNYTRFRRYNRDAEMDEICKKLRNLAREHKVCIIVASSLNRSVEGRSGAEGKRPQLSDLRESGSIEQMADKVLLLHRPEYYGIIEDYLGNSLIGILDVIVAKNSAGITDDIQLRFMGGYGITTLGRDINISNNFIDRIKELGMEVSNDAPF